MVPYQPGICVILYAVPRGGMAAWAIRTASRR
jgi:hypothetical protein